MTTGLVASDDVIAQLGAADEIRLLRERLAAWLEGVDDELRESLTWAFAGAPKHFRPVTLFACHRAVHETPASEAVDFAFAVELVHNMSLIVDDVLDGSDERRGIATVERRFGRLTALMASGYLVADAFDVFAEDPFADPPPVPSCSAGWRGGVPAVAAPAPAAGRRGLAADRRRGHRLDVRGLRGAGRALGALAPVRTSARRALPRLRRRRRPARRSKRSGAEAKRTSATAS